MTAEKYPRESGFPRIVLVRPTHPGNIGAVARAMKNMSLSDLCLVSPAIFPHAEATARASGADDILESAVVCATLEEALGSCQFVVASSARLRHVSRARYSPRECANYLCVDCAGFSTAIVFGTESSGLTNAEMALSQAQLFIPSSPQFSSLNLASSVQIIAYELFVAREAGLPTAASLQKAADMQLPEEDVWATVEEKLGCMRHLESLLEKINFAHLSNIKQSRLFMQRLYRLFHRMPLEVAEIHMLRGIFSALWKKIE